MEPTIKDMNWKWLGKVHDSGANPMLFDQERLLVTLIYCITNLNYRLTELENTLDIYRDRYGWDLPKEE